MVLEAEYRCKPGDVCLSIASAGDNTLSLLAKDPSKVVAIDLSASQIACLELRVAAYRKLTHVELLELMGARPSTPPPGTVCAAGCRNSTATSRKVWDAQPVGDRRRYRTGGQVRAIPGYDSSLRHQLQPTPVGSETICFCPERATSAKNVLRYATGTTGAGACWSRSPARGSSWAGWAGIPRFFKYAEGSVADHIMVWQSTLW